MRSTVAIAALLALIACKKQQSPTPPPAQEESSTEASAPAAAAKPAPAEPAEEKVAVDEALITKYIAFEKELLVAVREQMAKVQEAAADADKNKDSTASTLKATSKIASAGQEMDAREKELLKKHGLTQGQVAAVRDVVGEVIPARLVMKNAGGNKAMIQQMRDSLKNVPADKRAEAEAEIAKMEKSFDDMANAVEARKKFGDGAVDAVLKQEEELTNLQSDALKSLGGNK